MIELPEAKTLANQLNQTASSINFSPAENVFWFLVGGIISMFDKKVLKVLTLVFGAASLGFAVRGVAAGGGDPGPAVILMVAALICHTAYRKRNR